MRKFLLYCIVLIFSLGSFAQEFFVEKFTVVPTDLTASTYQRKDLNGNTCGLVKVQIPLQGVKFEGNLIGSADFRDGEYWVYLSPGTKQMLVKHSTATPTLISFPENGVSAIESKNTYTLRLALPGDDRAEVTFKVLPATARVSVDNAELPIVNGIGSLSLPTGQHTYFAVADGFNMQSQSFLVGKNSSNKIVIELDPFGTSGPTVTSTNMSSSGTQDEISLLRQLAQDGDATAQNELGERYFYGNGVEANMEEAAKWFLKAALQGNTAAEGSYGQFLLWGVGLEKNEVEAEKWLLKAARKGDRYAQNDLAFMYYYGWGIPEDYAKAFKWYEASAKQNYPDAQYGLGKMYLNGDGVKKNVKEAIKWMKKSADQDFSIAQNQLGLIYGNAMGVKKDYVEAAKWYKKASDNGLVDATHNLATMYLNGLGVPVNEKEAARLYRIAADKGDISSQNELGAMYFFGKGIEKDYLKAVELFTKSSEEGSDQGTANLGLMYEKGYGVEKDLDKAISLYKVAAAKGNKDAIGSLKRLNIAQ